MLSAAVKKHFDKTFSRIFFIQSACFNEDISINENQDITALTCNLQNYFIDDHGVRRVVPL